MRNFAAVLTIVLFIVGTTWGYPTGAPATVCDSMFPGHGVDEQPSPIPYTVTSSVSSIQPNEEVDLTIAGEGSKQFKGFLIEVREGNKAVGAFIINSNDPEAHTIDCHGNPNSAATQSNAEWKDKVVLKWRAPAKPGKYVINLTIVEDKVHFWAKKEVGAIQVV